MELIVLLFVAVLGFCWLISPLFVFSLMQRVDTLENKLRELEKERKRAEKRAAGVATGPATSESAAAASETTSDRLSEMPYPAAIPDPPPVPSDWSVYEIASSSSPSSTSPGANTVEASDVIGDQPVSVPPLAATSRTHVESARDAKEVAVAAKRVRRPQPEGDGSATFEERLGGMWLTWVGALAVIIGAGFGFKYAIENNWVGPQQRVIVGIINGLGCFAGGAYAKRRRYIFLAQGLTGAGLGVLYLSLYAAFGWYGIVSYEVAFVGMALTTALGLSFAGYFNVQPTAVLGLLGGYLTPVMLWPQSDPMWTLFPYLLMLDLGVLLIAGVRRWAGLEVLAFFGTIMIWLGWYQQFYTPDRLGVTAGFLTAFMFLFALLSIWHNVIRKRAAMGGDFFLIFVTPTAYFAALYGLTYARFPQWQAEFALALMLFYGVLAALARIWHPEGKSIIASLAGLAGSFLILAPPLELTGHWVTVCWITQAVLLVELGLYFREKSLAWTGLALLVKVQGILLIYFLGTLADPVHFQTAFVRIQLHLIGRPPTPIDSAESLMSLINGRSLSYLADVIAFAVLAWELGRRRTDAAALESLLPQRQAVQLWLNVTVPIAALTMIVLETYVWGQVWNWDATTIVSAWAIWTSVFACGVILWSQLFWTRGIEVVGWLLFGLLACFVGFEAIEALSVASLSGRIPAHRLEALWLLNPRGISVLAAISAMALTAMIYSRSLSRRQAATDELAPKNAPELVPLFAGAAYMLALGLVLLETRVWGAHHDWFATTTIAACAICATVFLIGATLWRIGSRAQWVDQIVPATLAILEVLVVVSTLSMLTLPQRPVNDIAVLVLDWWVINPHGVGFLVAAIGCGVAAWAYRNNVESSPLRDLRGWTLSQRLGLSGFCNALAMVLIETYTWGVLHGWMSGTLIGNSVGWISLFAVCLVAWSVKYRTTDYKILIGGLYVSLLFLLGILSVGGLYDLVLHQTNTSRMFRAPIEWWFLNPRGLGFVVSIAAGALSAWMYRKQNRRLDLSQWSDLGLTSMDASHVFAVSSYVLTFILFTLEVYVQGTSRQWETATSLAITLTWTAFATFTLMAGIYLRSGWVRVFSLAVFTLTVAKVFLMDVWQLETVIRVFAFISLGVALLLVSFLYRRFQNRIRSWMAPDLEASSV